MNIPFFRALLIYAFALAVPLPATAVTRTAPESCRVALAPSVQSKLDRLQVRLVQLDAASVKGLVDFLQKAFGYVSGDDPVFADIDPHFHKVVAKETAHHYRYWVLKSENGQILGGAGLTSTAKNTKNPTWWLDWFAIDESLRGNGLGKDLLRMVEAKGREMGIRQLKIYTSTSAGEAAANALYASFGYEIERSWEGTEGDGTKILNLIRRKTLTDK